MPPWKNTSRIALQYALSKPRPLYARDSSGQGGRLRARSPFLRGRRGALRTPTFGGSSLALLFWWQSLTPTLIPRSWEAQTVIGAVCLAIGYGIGTLAGRWMHRLLDRWGRSPG